MPDRSYRFLLWTLAVLGLLADQGSKYGVFAWLHGVESHTFALFQTQPERRFFSVVPVDPDRDTRALQRGFFLEVAFEQLGDENNPPVPHVNHGALFGFMRDQKPIQVFGKDIHPANAVFALISLLAATAIVVWSSYRKTAQDRWLCLALGLILAGTLGNLYDRLVFGGVRDFLHWNYLYNNPEGWPVFNIADCCLVIGAGLLMVQAFFAPASQQSPQQQKETELVAGGTTEG